MGVVFVLLTASLLVAAGFLAAFFWAVKSGQYEDTSTPAMRVLGEEDLFNADEHLTRLPAMRARTDAQVVVRFWYPQLIEEDRRHLGIVVLTGVDEHLAESLALRANSGVPRCQLEGE